MRIADGIRSNPLSDAADAAVFVVVVAVVVVVVVVVVVAVTVVWKCYFQLLMTSSVAFKTFVRQTTTNRCVDFCSSGKCRMAF